MMFYWTMNEKEQKQANNLMLLYSFATISIFSRTPS